MTFLKIFVLAVIQGAAELLPVSSSAHVIIAEKLMGLDPTTPEMTLLLVMLHTGTMFAVIFYFRKSWKKSFFASRKVLADSVKLIAVATIFTGITGIFLKTLIEKIAFRDAPHAEIELLFGNLGLIAAALAAVGVLIVYSGLRGNRSGKYGALGLTDSVTIGGIQGLCLPFRGFSRSGATISVGLLLGVARTRAEEFSFALAVVLTPPVIAREVIRLLKTQSAAAMSDATLANLFVPGLTGMALSFVSGILALRWLSAWLERGRWQLFGFYCLFMSAVVFMLYSQGF
ncbi:MAG TPA: undecaprenyl-diphosphate phosphatase [Geobacteraceae bacterium]|nr:undecaprenyl-diphosphate phosphatase [Geobacteraceae bacterium]